MEFGIEIKKGARRDKTSYSYDVEKGIISGSTKNRGSAAAAGKASGSLELENGKLKMELYIDRSLVEAFFNDTKSISIRSYSQYDSQGIELFADGDILVEELYVAQMASIYK